MSNILDAPPDATCSPDDLLTTWLDRRSEREDPEEPVEEAAAVGLDELPAGADATAARNLTVGMVLDGIPESIAIGLTLLGGGVVNGRRELGELRDLLLAPDGAVAALVVEQDEAVREVEPAGARIECVSTA